MLALLAPALALALLAAGIIGARALLGARWHIRPAPGGRGYGRTRRRTGLSRAELRRVARCLAAAGGNGRPVASRADGARDGRTGTGPADGIGHPGRVGIGTSGPIEYRNRGGYRVPEREPDGGFRNRNRE